MKPAKLDFIIGEDLYAVSLDELETRISTLKVEILRLESECKRKKAERDVAEKIFGNKK